MDNHIEIPKTCCQIHNTFLLKESKMPYFVCDLCNKEIPTCFCKKLCRRSLGESNSIYYDCKTDLCDFFTRACKKEKLCKLYVSSKKYRGKLFWGCHDNGCCSETGIFLGWVNDALKYKPNLTYNQFICLLIKTTTLEVYTRLLESHLLSNEFTEEDIEEIKFILEKEYADIINKNLIDMIETLKNTRFANHSTQSRYPQNFNSTSPSFPSTSPKTTIHSTHLQRSILNYSPEKSYDLYHQQQQQSPVYSHQPFTFDNYSQSQPTDDSLMRYNDELEKIRMKHRILYTEELKEIQKEYKEYHLLDAEKIRNENKELMRKDSQDIFNEIHLLSESIGNIQLQLNDISKSIKLSGVARPKKSKTTRSEPYYNLRSSKKK